MAEINLMEIINDLNNSGDYNEIVRIVEKELHRNTKDHWLLGVLSNAYYELKEYEKSYEIIGDALEIKEDCPLLWWHLANSLEALGKLKDSITVWKEITKHDKIQTDFLENPCWESYEFKEGLIVDSFYRIGKVYEKREKNKKAIKYYEKFIERKILLNEKDLESIYSLKNAIKEYKCLKEAFLPPLL